MSMTFDQVEQDILADDEQSVGLGGGQDELMERAQELADQIEKKALAYLQGSYTEIKSSMSERLEVWRQDEQRYHAEKKRLDDDTWFSKINPPRGARIVDMHKARMFGAIVPDTHRLDFFRLTPSSEQPEGVMPNDQDVLYAQLAEIALRNDLIGGNFTDELDNWLSDLYIFGQGYFLPLWELDIQFRFERVANPEYNQSLPPEQNVRVDIVDGVQVKTPIRPTIRRRVPVRQFDAPKLRHIRATNVFPTEFDRNDASQCTGVFIYDTCRLSDLREGEIKTGGYFYANLDKLKLSNERTDIPEVPDSSDRYLRDKSKQPKAEVAKGLDRATYLGRLRFDELIEELGVKEEMDSEAGQIAKALLVEKFDWEEDKLANWNTWIAEIVDDGGVLVRWQPSPYEEDRNPIQHHKLFGVSKCTLGDSIYDRIREEEHARNKMDQLRMMHTQKIVEPPVMIIKDYVEPRWWNAMGGTLKYRRNMVIPGLKGASMQQTVQPMEFSPVPLQVTDSAVSHLDDQISESAHLPAVRQGISTGGQTATEISQMGASADVMTDYLAKRAEASIEKAIDWLLLLHHQYTEEPRLVRYYDEQGELAFAQVPPEVWTRRYKVKLLGWESIGNREVRAMNFAEFSKIAQQFGWANQEAILLEHAKILQVRDPKRLIKQPEPQEPQPTVSVSRSLALQHERLPASVVAKEMQSGGGVIEITPEELQQMQQMEQALAVREVADQANVPIPLEAALPPGWMPEDSAMPPSPSHGLMRPPGASNDSGGFRSHHAPGELEMRQGGLHDAKGLQNSLGKRLQNPMNARRVTGV